MPQLGTYRYYAQEWAAFMNLVKDPSTSFNDLERAFKGITHLYFQTEEPIDPLHKINFQKSIEIAASRFTERDVMEGL